jgi:hypothetical protein
MNGLAAPRAAARAQFVRIADGLAVLVALSLPWSTSATSILAFLYALAVLPTLGSDSWRMLRTAPAIWLPVALVVLAILGVLWADIPIANRFIALHPFGKLLVLALVLLHFEKSERPHWVVGAFLVSCTVLLVASLVPIVVPSLRWMWTRGYGVPVNDYIMQTAEFLICVFALLYLAVERWRASRRGVSLALVALAALFLFSVLHVSVGRTALVALPVLAVLLGVRLYHWKGAAMAALLGLGLGLLAWASSPYLRERTMAVLTEVELYRTEGATTSSGYRLEFWRKSLQFIAAAPVLGHGTGSIEAQFSGARGSSGVSAVVTDNPHNQTLIIGIQLGVVGIALLWAMWIAHLLLFSTEGFIAWFGLVVTVEIVVGSMFNSLVHDFTSGWIYVMCVGAAGGAMLRRAR